MPKDKTMKFSDQDNSGDASQVKCAHCGKYIGMRRTRCPHCGIHFHGEAFQFKHKSEPDPSPRKSTPTTILAWIVLILIVISVLAALYLRSRT